MTNIKLRSGKRSGRLVLLTLTPIMAALMAVAPTISSAATAKYDATLDKVVVAGSASGLSANSKISVYDTTTQVLLYTINTNSTGKYTMPLPITGNGYIPCSVRLETVNAKNNAQTKTVLPVVGASSCAAAATCTISSPAKDSEITVGKSLKFAATIKSTKGTAAPDLLWKLGDGSPDQTTKTVKHTFDQVGRYRVTLNTLDATSGAAKCSDDVIVSVIPAPGTNPHGKVPELTKPPIAAAMPIITTKKKVTTVTNDENAYVVLPFEEMGMQGGSQIHLPYNSMINYNSLNAQLLKKLPNKPRIQSGSLIDNIDVTYSAASNDKDPLGKNSINSTSQNLFATGQVGANWDITNTVFSASQVPTDVKFFENQDYNQAKIRKTEQWDRIHQPFAVATGAKETGNTFAEKQSTFSPALPVEKPDEGVRGYVDLGAGTRKMPGFANAFIVNDPQKFDFNSYQDAFVAQFIPASDIDDQGRTNPYPLMRVQAKEKSADNTGKVLSTVDAVYTTASETRCRECHTPGGIAANEDVWRTPVNEAEMTDLTDPNKPGPATGAGNYDPGTDASKPWPPAIHNRFDNKHPDSVIGIQFAATNEVVPDVAPATTWAKTYLLPTDFVSIVGVYTTPALTTTLLDTEYKEDTVKVKGKDTKVLFTNVAKAVLRYNRTSFTNLGVTLDPNTATSATNIKTDQNGLRTDRVKASRWAEFDTATGKPTGKTQSTKPENAGPEWRLQVQLNFADASKYGNDTGTTDSWVNQEKAALFNTLVMHDYMVLYGPTPSIGNTWPASYSTQVADSYADDLGKSRAQPMYFCSGHHQSALKQDVGITGRAYQTNRSDYSKAFHAFHGKMQVYKNDVSATESADGLDHKKGDLIRDERGHPKMFGGRGWDSQLNDDNGVPLTMDSSGNFTVKTPQPYDVKKNNWRPDLYPMDVNGESMLPFGKQVPIEENCAKCHTGPTEKSYRDIHYTVGLKCDSCHSDMLAVGNVYGNESYDANLTGGGAYGADTVDKIEPADFRRPWLDEPDCGSCHIGDGNIKEGDAIGHAGHGHTLQNVFSAGTLKQAWMDGDTTGRSVTPMNARFAVMPTLEQRPEKATVNGATAYVEQPLSGVLYRKSGDVHGSGVNGVLTCSTCHGGSHAIWPNQDPNANDNQTAKQLQGYDGNIAECSVCHIKDDFKTGLVATDGGDPTAEFPNGVGVAQGIRAGNVVTPTGKTVDGSKGNGNAYLAGPHGLHPVGDESWYKHADNAASNTSAGTHNPDQNGGWHNDMAKKPGPDGEDQCAACHGSDHKGTRLSKTLTNRTLTNEKGKPVKVVKGQIISCDLCHSLEKSFTGAPNPTSPTGGWPAAAMHMPPMPQPISGGTSTGGGSGH